MSTLRLYATIAALGLALSLSATRAAAEQLVGKGEWASGRSSDAIRGTWTADLQRDGGSIAGTLTLTGSNLVDRADVSGTIDERQIVLGVTAKGTTQASFTGQLRGGSISGEWDFPAARNEGVWYGTLAPNRPSAGEQE